MGSVGDCYDHALFEGFFATLECEPLDRETFRTQYAARLAVFDFIEGWCNPHRRHSEGSRWAARRTMAPDPARSGRLHSGSGGPGRAPRPPARLTSQLSTQSGQVQLPKWLTGGTSFTCES